MPRITVLNYLSLIKFSHTIFALPFAIIGYFSGIKFSQTSFDPYLFGKILLCMVLARSSAMAFNRYADRHLDKLNPRTFFREIPSGIIHEKDAFSFVIINSTLFILVTWLINPLCFYLSPIALLVVLGYSYTKRFTSLCHLVLGLGLSLAPVGAYLAVTGEFALIPVLFSVAVLFWVSGFDIIYSMQDEDFDRGLNLHSIPGKLGRKNSLVVSQIFHFFSVIFLVAAGYFEQTGSWYWAGLLCFSGLLIYQHKLVKHDDLSKIDLTFFTTNGIASILFSIFYFLDLIF